MVTDTQSGKFAAALRGRRLVIVSNRLPFNVSVEGDQLIFHPSAGGLVTGLASVRESHKQLTALPSSYLWIGHQRRQCAVIVQ